MPSEETPRPTTAQALESLLVLELYFRDNPAMLEYLLRIRIAGGLGFPPRA